MAQADESYSTYLLGSLANHPGKVQEEFPSPESAVSMVSWIFLLLFTLVRCFNGLMRVLTAGKQENHC